MSLKQLRASVAKWRAKYAFRLARERYWIMLKRPKGIAKWSKLRHEAKDMIHQRLREIKAYKAKHPPKAKAASGEGYSVPETSWNPNRRPIANWIIREITDAVNNHGAQGHVNSGLRTYAEQKRLYEIYQHGGNIAAKPGQSNHEGYNYHSSPSGAVDWEPAESLNAALHRKPSHKLIWAESVGFGDHPHFSRTGH